MTTPTTKTEKEILDDAFGVLDACGHERLAYDVNQIIIKLRKRIVELSPPGNPLAGQGPFSKGLDLYGNPIE